VTASEAQCGSHFQSGATARGPSRPRAHPERAAEFVADAARTSWHDQALWFVRARRDRAADAVPDWEALRDEAAAIKRDALARLPELWERFEANAKQRGALVHWARDAAEHDAIVLELLRRHGVTRVVKSKSMLTEECALNEHLEAHGIEVIDTDLGERIVQLRREPPSHIVMPAIHLKKEEIGQLFAREMGSAPGLSDPTALTRVARRDLRARFLAAQAGITGVNFAVAESGGFVVVTNEGNADLGTTLPKLHIASVGLEKIVPRIADLPAFLRLLARSATGQALSVYTSHYHGPLAADREQHIVIVDNGRSRLLAHPSFWEALACIRCAACLNTCPVYRRSGGHSYQVAVAGPIGSVLAPARDATAHASLPHACSLCGSCSEVCPVRIPLHHQLLTWRGELTARGLRSARFRAAASLARFVLERPALFAAAGGLARMTARALPGIAARLAAPWTRGRELPPLPRESFRALYAKRRAHE
jgi:L-lactate dehydrogenase complex protein LldF